MEIKFSKLLEMDPESIEFLRSYRRKFVVYKFTDLESGMVYIGSTKNLPGRFYNKLYGYTDIVLRKSRKEPRTKIHKALKQRPDDFILTIECVFDSEESMLEMEASLIKKYDSYEHGYNSTSDGGGIYGSCGPNSPGAKFRGCGIWVTDGSKNIMIFNHELHEYEKLGFKKGITFDKSKPNGNRNLVFINNGEKSIKIHPEDLDLYLSEGWVKGRINVREFDRSSKIRGFIYVTNGSENKAIPKEELSNYLADGWMKGKTLDYSGKYIGVNDGKVNFRILKEDLDEFLKVPGNSVGWMRSPKQIDKAWVNNGEEERLIPKIDLEVYLNSGWVTGKFPLIKSRGRVRINNGVCNTTVDKEVLEEYLSNGWKLGMKPRSQK